MERCQTLPKTANSLTDASQRAAAQVVVVVSGRADLNLPHFHGFQLIVWRFWWRLAFDIC